MKVRHWFHNHKEINVSLFIFIKFKGMWIILSVKIDEILIFPRLGGPDKKVVILLSKVDTKSKLWPCDNCQSLSKLSSLSDDWDFWSRILSRILVEAKRSYLDRLFPSQYLEKTFLKKYPSQFWLVWTPRLIYPLLIISGCQEFAFWTGFVRSAKDFTLSTRKICFGDHKE